jgi:hypothetical protein
MVLESMHEKTEEAMCKLLQSLLRTYVSFKFYPLSCGLGSLVLFAIWTEAEVTEKAKSLG